MNFRSATLVMLDVITAKENRRGCRTFRITMRCKTTDLYLQN